MGANAICFTLLMTTCFVRDEHNAVSFGPLLSLEQSHNLTPLINSVQLPLSSSDFRNILIPQQQQQQLSHQLPDQSQPQTSIQHSQDRVPHQIHSQSLPSEFLPSLNLLVSSTQRPVKIVRSTTTQQPTLSVPSKSSQLFIPSISEDNLHQHTSGNTRAPLLSQNITARSTQLRGSGTENIQLSNPHNSPVFQRIADKLRIGDVTRQYKIDKLMKRPQHQRTSRYAYLMYKLMKLVQEINKLNKKQHESYEAAPLPSSSLEIRGKSAYDIPPLTIPMPEIPNFETVRSQISFFKAKHKKFFEQQHWVATREIDVQDNSQPKQQQTVNPLTISESEHEHVEASEQTPTRYEIKQYHASPVQSYDHYLFPKVMLPLHNEFYGLPPINYSINNEPFSVSTWKNVIGIIHQNDHSDEANTPSWSDAEHLQKIGDAQLDHKVLRRKRDTVTDINGTTENIVISNTENATTLSAPIIVLNNTITEIENEPHAERLSESTVGALQQESIDALINKYTSKTSTNLSFAESILRALSSEETSDETGDTIALFNSTQFKLPIIPTTTLRSIAAENVGSKDSEPLASNVIGDPRKLHGADLIRFLDEALQNSSQYLPDESNERKNEVVNTPTDLVKFPYYEDSSETINVDSALRFAENLTTFSNSLYESKNGVQCPDVDVELDEEPEEPDSGEGFKPVRRLKNLGTKVDCLKEKHFGKDPLDNPLFKEEFVGSFRTGRGKHIDLPKQPDHSVAVYSDVLRSIKKHLTEERRLKAADFDAPTPRQQGFSERSIYTPNNALWEQVRFGKRKIPTISTEKRAEEHNAEQNQTSANVDHHALRLVFPKRLNFTKNNDAGKRISRFNHTRRSDLENYKTKLNGTRLVDMDSFKAKLNQSKLTDQESNKANSTQIRPANFENYKAKLNASRRVNLENYKAKFNQPRLADYRSKVNLSKPIDLDSYKNKFNLSGLPELDNYRSRFNYTRFADNDNYKNPIAKKINLKKVNKIRVPTSQRRDSNINLQHDSNSPNSQRFNNPTIFDISTFYPRVNNGRKSRKYPSKLEILEYEAKELLNNVRKKPEDRFDTSTHGTRDLAESYRVNSSKSYGTSYSPSYDQFKPPSSPIKSHNDDDQTSPPSLDQLINFYSQRRDGDSQEGPVHRNTKISETPNNDRDAERSAEIGPSESQEKSYSDESQSSHFPLQGNRGRHATAPPLRDDIADIFDDPVLPSPTSSTPAISTGNERHLNRKRKQSDTAKKGTGPKRHKTDHINLIRPPVGHRSEELSYYH